MVISFIGGIIAYYTKYNSALLEEPIYNYNREDSLFNNAQLKVNQLLTEKNVDSNTKLSHFSKDKLHKRSKQKHLNTIININTANISTLTKISGIGIKTAQKIIEFRNLNGRFNSVDELLKIKGIGKVKLSRIKKYITTE